MLQQAIIEKTFQQEKSRFGDPFAQTEDAHRKSWITVDEFVQATGSIRVCKLGHLHVNMQLLDSLACTLTKNTTITSFRVHLRFAGQNLGAC